MCTSCPVVETIDKLYKGGHNGKSKNIINSLNISFDDVDFMVSLFELKIARLKLKNDTEEINRQLSVFINKSKSSLYDEIYDEMTAQHYLSKYLQKILTNIKTMELTLIDVIKSSNIDIAISIPNIVVKKEKKTLGLYNLARGIWEYLSKLNISSITGKLDSIPAPMFTLLNVDLSGNISSKPENTINEILQIYDIAKKDEQQICELIKYCIQLEQRVKLILEKLLIVL